MEELIIVHKEPIVEFYTGKWTISDKSIFYYINKEGKRVNIHEDHVTKEVKEFIRTNIIDNKSVIGSYDRYHKNIEYIVNLAENKIVVEEIPNFDNLFIVRF
jgi:hypothetical protein